MARPKKDPKAPNPEIDKMIKLMRDKFEGLPPDVQLNVIKTAVMWEKVKAGIKNEGDGSFFGNKGDEDDDE
jgi:hypothetical protein